LLAAVAHAAPVPVTDIITAPGFGPEAIETNGQTLVYIRTAAGWHAPAGATCSYCPVGSAGGAPDEIPPASRMSALSGLKYTQGVLNFGANGAKCDLGVIVTNDSVGIVLGELGTSSQHAGDPVTVYPTYGGARVGTWARELGASDYGEINKTWRFCYSITQDLHCFLTTFRLSDFTNGTGELLFDGIELAGNAGYDPNLVATIGAPVSLYVPEVSRVLPVTAMTFSPGFGESLELNGQTLTGITTEEGSFASVTGLTCVANAGVDWIDKAFSEAMPLSTNEALSGLTFTQFAANPVSVDFALGTALSQNEDTRVRFMLGEITTVVSGVPVAADPVTIRPLSGGTLIGDWALQIDASAYGVESAPWRGTKLGPTTPMAGRMVSFALTDFTGGLPGMLTHVDGFRVYCGDMADPNVFGTYEIPQPSPQGTIISVQ
jgi:hypothetical protein